LSVQPSELVLREIAENITMDPSPRTHGEYDYTLARLSPKDIKHSMLAIVPPDLKHGDPCSVCGQPLRAPCGGVLGKAIRCGDAESRGVISFLICVAPHHLNCHIKP
jgi:hypothetical protein